jgi:hypothetical protein
MLVIPWAACASYSERAQHILSPLNQRIKALNFVPFNPPRAHAEIWSVLNFRRHQENFVLSPQECGTNAKPFINETEAITLSSAYQLDDRDSFAIALAKSLSPNFNLDAALTHRSVKRIEMAFFKPKIYQASILSSSNMVNQLNATSPCYPQMKRKDVLLLTGLLQVEGLVYRMYDTNNNAISVDSTIYQEVGLTAKTEATATGAHSLLITNKSFIGYTSVVPQQLGGLLEGKFDVVQAHPELVEEMRARAE